MTVAVLPWWAASITGWLALVAAWSVAATIRRLLNRPMTAAV